MAYDFREFTSRGQPGFKFDPAEEARKCRAILAPLNADERKIARQVNPHIELYSYCLVQYHYPYQRGLWEKYCKDNKIDSALGYLHDENGDFIYTNDNSGRDEEGHYTWPVARLEHPYVKWVANEFLAPILKDFDGVIYDAPIVSGSFVDRNGNPATPAEYDPAEHQRLCIAMILWLRFAIGWDKQVLINASTYWWYKRSKLAPMYQKCKDIAKGIYFETGGLWSEPEFRDTIVFMGMQPKNFFTSWNSGSGPLDPKEAPYEEPPIFRAPISAPPPPIPGP